MTKIRNKLTGEVIDLATSKVETKVSDKKTTARGRFVARTEERFVEAAKRIEARGTIQDKLRSQFEKPELMSKVMGTLTAIGAPVAAIESAMANPILLAQQGNFSPKDLAKEAILGATLQKQGQYGDVFKNVGVQEEIADAAGLFLNVAAPAKLLKAVNNTFGKISKMTDKGILKAGNQLVGASDDAVKAMGTEVGKAFSVADNLPTDKIGFLDDVVKMPKSLVKAAEEQFGNIDDFVQTLTVGKLREFKRFIGKFRSTSFGKSERGLAENIDAQKINTVYASIKNMMRKTIKDGMGEKESNIIMKMEEAFADVIRSGNVIKKTVVDPTLRKATKAGSAADKLIKEGDVTFRIALNTLKKAGSKSRKAVNKSISLLNNYNRHRRNIEFTRKAAGAVIFGGAAGAVGGKALQKVSGEQN